MRQRFFSASIFLIATLYVMLSAPSWLESQSTTAGVSGAQSSLAAASPEGMSLIPGATFLIGIDSSEILRF